MHFENNSAMLLGQKMQRANKCNNSMQQLQSDVAYPLPSASLLTFDFMHKSLRCIVYSKEYYSRVSFLTFNLELIQKSSDRLSRFYVRFLKFEQLSEISQNSDNSVQVMANFLKIFLLYKKHFCI